MKMCKYCIRRGHSQKHNTHYLRVKCVLQAHHENNAYCVRIKGVLCKYASAHLQQPDGLKVAVKTLTNMTLTERNVPLLLSHACPCAGRVDVYHK